MKKRLKKMTAALIAVLMIVMMCSCGSSYDYNKELDGICKYLEETYGDDLRAGDSASDWTVILYSKAGVDYDFETYLNDMENYVTSCYATEDKLDRVKATEWQRIALAVEAAGGDPEKFGSDKDGKPINLIADGTYNWQQTDSLDTQGSNGLIYALIAIKSGDHKVPSDSKYSELQIVSSLLSYQQDNGGFALGEGGGADPDITAMAVQALAPYRANLPQAEMAVAKALDYLSAEQADSGMFKYEGSYSSETSSQVIMALCAAGVDPAENEAFAKDGRNVIDGLLEYKMDNGSYSHELPDDKSADTDNVMSSQQAGLAFAALVDMGKDKADE